MRSLGRFGLIVPLIAALVSGCAHPAEFTAQDQMCEVPKTYLEVEAHDDPVIEDSLTGSTSFSQSIRNAYQAPPAPETGFNKDPVTSSMLLLSGGSQHGAFGGGFVREWALERPSGLPRFKVVTGISTGAIYATHAFLNRTDVIVKNEHIFREGEILKRYVGNGGMKTLGGGFTTVKKGSVGDLYPMRDRYLGELTDEVVRAVAREADDGRKLYIAAVDLDLGKAAIFDMTQYAQSYRAVPRSDQARLDRMRLCFSNVILASSSVPVAAPPTVIDNRMYIDGGARFGFITDEIGKTADELGNWFAAAARNNLEGGVPAHRPNLYLLVNGTLEVELQCGKLKKSQVDNPCPPGTPKASPEGQHEKWDILSLIGRSVDILINQIYRFSNDRVWVASSGWGFIPHMQRMLPTSTSECANFPRSRASRVLRRPVTIGPG